MAPTRKDARAKLLDAALATVRAKGFAATTVDDLCRAAGVTKGAFFHHFHSKEELGVAAARHWGNVTTPLFAAAPYHAPEDARDRLLAYLEFRKTLLDGPLPEITCFAGTTVQEAYATYPAIRDACGEVIAGHAATLEPDFEAAIARYGAPEGVTARSLALHTQAVLQGAFILAKALDDPGVAADSIDHLGRYLANLFPKPEETMP
jgi:TetR/AcrR family transcriptional regulator, transcriptional repressor for nem operon